MNALLRMAAASMAVSTAKRRVERALHHTAVLLITFTIALAGAAFLVSALWMWIAMESTPLIASLIVGGLFLVLASLVYLFGAVLVRHEPRRSALIDPGAVSAQIQMAAHSVAGNRPMIANLAIVAGVGYVLGRVMLRK